MPSPKRGLGPRGLAAIEQSSGLFWEKRLNEPIPSDETAAPTSPLRNASAITVSQPDEAAFNPDWWYTFASSRVKEAAYDKTNQRLYIRWQDGRVGYVYEGVPQSTWRGFRRSRSAGKYVNSRLNSYDYHPVNF